MQSKSRTPYDQLWEGLMKNLTADLFNEDRVEIEGVMQDIASFDPRFRQKTLALCHTLSLSAPSLVPSVVKRLRKTSQALKPREMERWVTRAFDLLESKGMDQFFRFLSTTHDDALEEFRTREGLSLQAVSAILEAYLRGISGITLTVGQAEESYTDTGTVYLPPLLSVFKDRDRNFLLYKMAAAHKWAQIAAGTLTPQVESPHGADGAAVTADRGLEELFAHYDNQELAADLYNLLEAARLESFLHRELPGLMREAQELKQEIFLTRRSLRGLSEQSAFVEGLYQYFLKGRVKGLMPAPLPAALTALDHAAQFTSPAETQGILKDLYEAATKLEGPYQHRSFPYIGAIKPDRVALCISRRKEQRRKQIEEMISKIVDMPDIEVETRKAAPAAQTRVERKPRKDAEYLLVKGKLFELDEETKAVIRQSGLFSDGILLDGSSVKEGSVIFSIGDFLEGADREETGVGIRYDEWDYRRGDYKRDWCTLIEKDIHPSDEPFVDLTLKRYWGYIKILRRKFELLRKDLRILRRQKDGDDIDIDATVEAFSDIKAGISPGENVFTKLDRQERNIAALFLLDMSGSTKGWVNDVEKEALVLMSEALDSLGDRYAIYGFSGIARSNCEYFTIKRFDDRYGERVKKRIAGIGPKDYTRMGPPLRHSARILRSLDARTKLLIVLSDGKPEDRDGYKGDYAIEDTRKALIEAKEQGIKAFCITIDREASAYLPHLFGEVSYTVLDDVRKLPNRITEIYRSLTT